MGAPLLTITFPKDTYLGQISLSLAGVTPRVYTGPAMTMSAVRSQFQSNYGYNCAQTDSAIQAIINRSAGYMPDSHIMSSIIGSMYWLDSLAGLVPH